jgi:ribosomal protein L14
MVIKILGKKAGSPGHIGDRCVVVCKEVRKNIATGKQKVGKSDIRHAIITRTRLTVFLKPSKNKNYIIYFLYISFR